MEIVSVDPRSLSNDMLTQHYSSKLSVNGFLIIDNPVNSESSWGDYYVDHRTIVLYSQHMSLHRFNLTVLHEITHHVCNIAFDYLGHGEIFRRALSHIIDLYYEYDVPNEINVLLKEDGLYYEFKSTKERRESQLNFWGAWEMAKA